MIMKETVAVVELTCVVRWQHDSVTYLLGHRTDVNSTAAAIVCYVGTIVV